jgi:hypothetical protein
MQADSNVAESFYQRATVYEFEVTYGKADTLEALELTSNEIMPWISSKETIFSAPFTTD